MRFRLRFERIYGSDSRLGDTPRQSPPRSPIQIENYPFPGERLTIYLGQPVEELYRTYHIAKAGGFTLVRRNVAHEKVTEEDEAEALQQAQTEPLADDLGRWNWYVTILIERVVDVPDEQCTPGRWFCIDPTLAIAYENEFLSYGGYQADFIVDHLSSHIPRQFFTIRDVEDRVVFLPEDRPPFRMFKITFGDVTLSTTGHLESCDVSRIRAALADLQHNGDLALAPLTPSTLLSLLERAEKSDLKGRALEELVAKLFSTIAGLTVVTRVRTATEEIDIGVFNDAPEGFLASEEALILAECKNWSGKCGRDEFSLLEQKAKNRRKRCSLAVLISWNGFANTIEKELLRSSRQRLVIVPLTGQDLKRAVAENNFLEVLESAWRSTLLI
jgi:hypothetical protein